MKAKIILLFFLFLLISIGIFHYSSKISFIRDIKNKYFCVREGQIGNRFKGHLCCPGLKEDSCGPWMRENQISNIKNLSLGNTPQATGDFVCIRCGDGICKKEESLCNCLQDCGDKK